MPAQDPGPSKCEDHGCRDRGVGTGSEHQPEKKTEELAASRVGADPHGDEQGRHGEYGEHSRLYAHQRPVGKWVIGEHQSARDEPEMRCCREPATQPVGEHGRSHHEHDTRDLHEQGGSRLVENQRAQAHVEREQETRGSLHPFTRIPHEAVAVSQVPRVAERNHRVVEEAEVASATGLDGAPGDEHRRPPGVDQCQNCEEDGMPSDALRRLLGHDRGQA
jgi:hypothetical protein